MATKLSRIFEIVFDPKTLGGAAAGAALGSVVPGVGTALGGIIGGGVGALASIIGGAGGGEKSTADVNVNINAPKGVVRSVESKSVGPVNLNLGNNLDFAGGTI